jgi:hypothetical protein
MKQFLREEQPFVSRPVLLRVVGCEHMSSAAFFGVEGPVPVPTPYIENRFIPKFNRIKL